MKKLNINRDLVPFKITFFLRFGGAAFIAFIAPITRQRGISPEGIGLLWMINPLISVAYNIICGHCADKWKIHRAILMANSAVFAISLTAFHFMPDIPKPAQSMPNIMMNAQCSGNYTSLFMCPTDVESQVALDNVITPCSMNGSHSNIVRTDICDAHCKVIMSDDGELLPLQKNIFPNGILPMSNSSICQERKCFNISHINVTKLLSNTTTQSCSEISVVLDCLITCETSNTEKNIPFSYMLRTVEFWLTAFTLVIIFISNDSCNSLTDAMIFVVLGENRHKYGQTRMFGPLGWGLMGACMGILVDFCSKGQEESNYTPAMVITSCFLFFNFIFTSRIDVQVPGKQSKGSIRSVLLSYHCITLLINAFVMGFTMAFIWTFEFIHIGVIAKEWDPNFSHLNLLYGLLVFTDCVLVEVPFLFLSGYIIKKLSNIRTFAITLMVMSIRVTLYSVLFIPWLFLPVHLLHGISFGVFMANMISYASHLAPKGAEATMQSITLGFFIVGKSIGALIGGVMFEALGGSKTFMLLGLTLFTYTIIYIIVNCGTSRFKCISRQVTDDGRGEYKEANAVEEMEKTKVTESQKSDGNQQCKVSESFALELDKNI